VLDETIHVSSERYRVPYEATLEFVDSTVLPYVEILPLGEEEYGKAAEVLRAYGIKPSDALHVAAMTSRGISRIASEDREFDRVRGISRMWPL